MLLVFLCALWGLQQVAIKQAISEGLPPMLQAAFRSTLAGSILLVWIAWRQGAGSLRAMVDRTSPRWPGLVLALSFSLEFMAVYPGLQRTTASRGVLFLYAAPFFTALIAHFFIPAERLKPRQMLGLVVAFAGVALAFGQGLVSGSGDLLGDALCGFAALCWGFNTALVKANARLRAAPATHVLLYQIGGSAPVLLVAAWAFGDLGHMPVASAMAWGILVFQAVVIAFASYLAWFWLMTIYPATQLAGFTFLTPLFGILAGVLLLGEPLALTLFAGLAAIAVGMRLLR